MPRQAYWIILTNPHISETYVWPVEGPQYQIAPEDGLKKEDTVYLWANGFSSFFAWGKVAETPRTITIEERRAYDTEKLKRMVVWVNNLHGLNPPITQEMLYADSNLRKLIPTGYDDLVAIPLRPGQAAYINDYIRERNLDSPAPRASTTIRWFAEEIPPQVTIQALIIAGDKVSEGRLVEGVGIAWNEIVKMIVRNPEELYNIDPRSFEELIAGAYEKSGEFDRVILTPRSGDKGRDVIAEKDGFGSLRIIDQIKRNRITHPVTADDVRALVGVVYMDHNVSKGIVTTSGLFAPNIEKDEQIQKVLPYRLELRPRDILIPWLQRLSGR